MSNLAHVRGTGEVRVAPSSPLSSEAESTKAHSRCQRPARSALSLPRRHLDRSGNRVDVDEAIRTRRTLKDFTRQQVEVPLLQELLSLAVLAPNHHETEPW